MTSHPDLARAVLPLVRGAVIPAFDARSIREEPVRLPDPRQRWVHLQFRRFAGCPVCNYHLLTLSRRLPEIQAAGIREVVVFHATRDEMLKYQAQLPFDCVADPERALYRRFGVETSWRAVLHPRVLLSGARWVLASRRFYRKAENGINGLPADFLIAQDGRLHAVHRGTHADDQWSVDELLAHAASP